MRQRQKIALARRLRREMTDAEHQLWHHLRNRAFTGFKFRRQHPVGPYVADFACLEKRLIVELDGSQHLDSSPDAIRDRWLGRVGYTVLRFWNNEVFEELDGVLEVIHAALQQPSPQPLSRERERG